MRLLGKIEARATNNFSACAWILERRFPELFSRPEVQLNLQTNIVQNNLSITISPEEVREIEAEAVPCRNWTCHRHYSFYHNESTRRLVEKYYAKDIETFGYRFESPSGILRWGVPERLGIRLRSRLGRLVQAG
jgi:hypothetical protein